MRTTLKKTLASVVIAAGVTGGTTGAAFAATTTTTAPSTSPAETAVKQIQTKAAAAVSARLASLSSAIADVQSNKWLTSADKHAALTILQNDQTQLPGLGQKIAADTTVAQAAADYRTIFTGYRVYALALPQVHMAAVADDLTSGVVPRLSDAQNRLQALVSGSDQSKNTGAVAQAMADLAQQISTITNDTNGLSGTLLGYTPAQWDANPALLQPAHSSLVAARSAAAAARKDIATVVEAIK